jgi:hypothetical protein
VPFMSLYDRHSSHLCLDSGTQTTLYPMGEGFLMYSGG